MRVGILTVSDGCHAGTREDASGGVVVTWCHERGYEAAARDVVPDDIDRIVPVLLAWCDRLGLDLVVTTGGTGLGPRDRTPEATRTVLEREAQGIAEAIRRRGAEKIPTALLSRGLAGARGSTLVVNLPGSPGGVRDGLDVLSGCVEHAVRLLRGEDAPHPGPSAGSGS